jgi:hypothetical protein
VSWALDDERRRRTNTVLLACGVGIACLVAALALVVVARRDGGVGGGETGATPPAAQQVTRENVRWVEVEGLRLPVTPAGPARTTAGRAEGFARTPAGAVLAAVHIGYRVEATLGPSVYRPTIEEQVVGADKERFLSKVDQEYRGGETSGVSPTGALVREVEKAKATRSQMWAHRVDSFDPSVAVVQLLMRTFPAGGSAPAWVNFAWTVRWVDDDWRLVAPLNGDFRNTARQVAGVPAGYTIFGDE